MADTPRTRITADATGKVVEVPTQKSPTEVLTDHLKQVQVTAMLCESSVELAEFSMYVSKAMAMIPLLTTHTEGA